MRSERAVETQGANSYVPQSMSFSMQVLARARWPGSANHSIDGLIRERRRVAGRRCPEGPSCRAAVPNLLDDRTNGHFRSLPALILRFQASATVPPMVHRHAANSRAIAAATTCAFLPAALSRR